MIKVDTGTAKKAARTAVLAGLFVATFLLFLIMTFPYEVLKESIAANLSKATGYNIAIGDMGASLPLGMVVEKVRVESSTPGIAIELKSLRLNISVLRLFIGQLGIAIEATAGKGQLDLGAIFSLFDLIGGAPLPKHVTLVSKSFPLDDIALFVLNNAANSPTANPLIAPMLANIGVNALLNAAVDFNIEPKTPAQSTGQADLQLANAVLKLSDKSIGLKDQTFKKAQLKLKVEGGVLVIDKASAFISDGLELVPGGKISLKQPPMTSQLDLKIAFKLTNDLKSMFGFLLGSGSSNSEGELTTQIRGTLEQPLTMNL